MTTNIFPELNIDELTAFVNRINPQLNKNVKLCVESHDDEDNTGHIYAVEVDQNGEDSDAMWGWLIDVPCAECEKFYFMYGGNFPHDQEGSCEIDDASFIAKVNSLKF